MAGSFRALRPATSEPHDLHDFYTARIARLEGAIDRLVERVRELETRVGAAGLDPRAINPDGLYTPSQAAALIGCSRQTVYTKVHRGVLPAVRVGGADSLGRAPQMIRGADILALLRPARGG